MAPGNKKSKPKAKANTMPAAGSSDKLQDAAASYVSDIENAGLNWPAIVDILCVYFDIDLSSRHGFKKVHLRFDKIYQRLDKAYTKHSSSSSIDTRIVGGIVGIYAKMSSADAVIRNKLFDKGFLPKLLSLLEIPECIHLGLQSLSSVTHHSGASARIQIARHSMTLVRLLQELPYDAKVSELVIATLSHSIGSVTSGDEVPGNPETLKSLDMATILRVVTEQMRKPEASVAAINHGMALIANSTLHVKIPPSSISFLVAGLRSKDWIFRCSCLGGLVRLFRNQADSDLDCVLDPHKLIAQVRRGFPPHLSDLMIDYGHERCETILTLKAKAENTKAQMKCAQDHDIYALGLVLAGCIPKTEFSITAGGLQSQNPATGAWETEDVGLPWVMWIDCLPHCAKAIREKGIASQIVLADMLDIKYHISKQRIPAAIKLAKEALGRMEHAYFYYAISLTADTTEGLRAAKKGMKCRVTTPFIHFQMMQRAVVHAGDLGITMLQSASLNDQKTWEEGIAFLWSSLNDAKSYISQAPPDNRHMKTVLYWYILLTIVTKGPELTDLHDLDAAFKSLKISDEFSQILGITSINTNFKLTQEAVIKHFPTAFRDWAGTIDRFDSLASIKVHDSPEKAKDDLAAWLEDIEDEGIPEAKQKCVHPILTSHTVEFYTCTWCGNPSAALRKCSGCTKTRYCDAACQKSDWATHKRVCKT